ncbi:MAG: hypothetical protein ABI729_08465, partial [Chitinophagales bacterium]
MKQLYMRTIKILTGGRGKWLSYCCVFLLFSTLPDLVNAQLVVTTPVTAQQIVDNMLGCSSAASNI